MPFKRLIFPSKCRYYEGKILMMLLKRIIFLPLKNAMKKERSSYEHKAQKKADASLVRISVPVIMRCQPGYGRCGKPWAGSNNQERGG